MAARSRLPDLIATFLGYFIAGKVGLMAPFTSGNVSPVWPASGAALAAVLLFGLEVWPAVMAGAFCVNFFSPIPPLAAAGLAVGNCSSAVAGGWLLRRTAGFDLSLRRLRDVPTFVALGALLSPMLAATVGTATLYALRVSAWSDFGTAWRMWWLGDAMGVLLVAPLLAALAAAGREKQPARSAFELAGLVTGTSLASLGVFTTLFGSPGKYGVPALIVVPFVVWGALRFRTLGASLASFLVAALAAWATASGFGPFTRFDAVSNAELLQFFLAVVSITGLILAAVTSERQRAGEALRELSSRLLRLQDDERRRLARELHDGTGQSLTALKMNLASARRLAGTEGRLDDLLRRSMEATDVIVHEIRNMSYLLHPPLLDEAGLASALRWYVDGAAQQAKLNVTLTVSPELGRLPRHLETAVFRIAQECLTNILRHSGSDSAAIRVEREGGRILLTVRDSGKGIPDSRRDGWGGVGIRGMRERARELGGSFTIRPGRPGTVVEASLPLPRD